MKIRWDLLMDMMNDIQRNLQRGLVSDDRRVTTERFGPEAPIVFRTVVVF